MMYSSLLDEADVKVVYDSQGNKREVLISYEKYQAIVDFIERYAYFYSPEVQERLQKSDEDLRAGRYIEVNAVDVDRALEWLNE
ncbi:MAG: hypothetical protein ABIL11_03820 [Chloroflexota bacterium]